MIDTRFLIFLVLLLRQDESYSCFALHRRVYHVISSELEHVGPVLIFGSPMFVVKSIRNNTESKALCSLAGVDRNSSPPPLHRTDRVMYPIESRDGTSALSVKKYWTSGTNAEMIGAFSTLVPLNLQARVPNRPYGRLI